MYGSDPCLRSVGIRDRRCKFHFRFQQHAVRPRIFEVGDVFVRLIVVTGELRGGRTASRCDVELLPYKQPEPSRRRACLVYGVETSLSQIRFRFRSPDGLAKCSVLRCQ